MWNGIIGGDDMGVKKEMTNLYQAGKEETETKLIKNLLKADVEIDKIVEASGLSKEQIERIKEKAQH